MIDHDAAYSVVAELYPELCRIVLFVAFEEADTDAEPNYQQIIFTADSQAAFRLDCARDDCIGGGFDFAPVIDTLVTSQEPSVHGTLACAGTIDSGDACCSLQSEYRIFVV